MNDNMIRWERDDNIVVLTMDDPSRPTNTMTDLFERSLRETVDRLHAEKDTFDGVILTSAKETFFAGGDLELLMNAGRGDVESIASGLDSYKTSFRRLETLGKPVVAAINGTALGGGFEVALACHHRIVLNKPGVRLGLPEVTLGLLPGAGGVTRTVRMVGILNALLNVVGQGQRMTPDKAREVGIVDHVVDAPETMMAAARAWIASNPDAAQPWDMPGYKIPGGTPASPALAANLPAVPANLRKQLKGAPMPAPAAVLATAVEGAQVDIDAAFAIETRYCTNLICGQVSTNMIKALFFDVNTINKRAARPNDAPVRSVNRVAILGAGMMGAAIAYVAAKNGADVILRDLTIEAAERGKDYARGILNTRVAKGGMAESARDAILDRIKVTADVSDAKGADFVIEAVFEDIELKRKVLAEVERYVAPDALIATNTSALELAGIVDSLARPANFVGLHFFSPVDKMPLVEVIVGGQTSDESLARALDLVFWMKKTPIVVKDVYAFYANRVIGQFVDQALSLVAEGMHPASVEQATTQAGFPVGALALLDEVNMKTVYKIRQGSIADQGHDFVETPGGPLLDAMVDVHKRPGRLEGAGFYEYDSDGRRLGLWPELVAQHHRPEVEIPFEDAKERMLFAAAIEAARCFDAGIVESVPDANIGSIMGIGFPVWTGGTLQYISQYDGGVDGFVRRADDLRSKYGERFLVPDALRARAASGESFA